MTTTTNNNTRALSICVYCGSRHGASPLYEQAARRLGELIGSRGWQLVYGGGRVGLMGVVADAALARGGTAVGVIPDSLRRREVGHHGLTELHVVQTMHERKHLMAERSDIFIALPGGIGTMEELFEVWTWRQLGYHDKPIGLLNIGGYYDPLLAFMQRTVDEEFLTEAQLHTVEVDTDPAQLLETLVQKHRGAQAPDDYSRI